MILDGSPSLFPQGTSGKIVQVQHARLIATDLTTALIDPLFLVVLSVPITARNGTYLIAHAQQGVQASGGVEVCINSIRIGGGFIDQWSTVVTGTIIQSFNQIKYPLVGQAGAGLHTVESTFAKNSASANSLRILTVGLNARFWSASLTVYEVEL